MFRWEAQGPSDSVTSAKVTGMSQEGDTDFRQARLRPQTADRTQTMLLTWPQEAQTEARAQASCGESLCQALQPARVQTLDTGQGPALLTGISSQHKPIVTSLSLCKGTLCLKLLFKVVNTYKSVLDLEKMGTCVYFTMS